MESKRINKYISEAGLCSRREADKLIEEGHVTIDGKKAKTGSPVLPGQVVKVRGEVIGGNFKSIILAYNKPVGVVSTSDDSDPNNIVDAIGYDERIFPIGRLDKDSQGLILLTNEGDIVNKILRVGNNHEKEYLVTVNKPIDAAFIKGMQSGVPILGIVTRKCEITKIGARIFSIVLRQGLNRQIRRMCEYFNYDVVSLERIRIMNIKLGNLRQGQSRLLTKEEEAEIRRIISQSVKTEEASKPKTKLPRMYKPSGPASKGGNTNYPSNPKSQTVRSGRVNKSDRGDSTIFSVEPEFRGRGTKPSAAKGTRGVEPEFKGRGAKTSVGRGTRGVEPEFRGRTTKPNATRGTRGVEPEFKGRGAKPNATGGARGAEPEFRGRIGKSKANVEIKPDRPFKSNDRFKPKESAPSNKSNKPNKPVREPRKVNEKGRKR